MRFEWDEQKNTSNLRKHGVRFTVATAVFYDPWHLMEQDREVEDEERWQTIGLVGDRYLLLVAHTVEDDGNEEVVRLISAREATAHERKRYVDQIQA